MAHQCRICDDGFVKNKVVSLAGSAIIEFSCERCGFYMMTRNFDLNVVIRDDLRPYLSAAARQAHEGGSPITFHENNDLTEIAKRHSATRVGERLDKLLRHLSRQWEVLVPLNTYRDYPLADARDESQFDVYLTHLVDAGLIKGHPPQVQGEGWEYNLTVRGLEVIEASLASGAIAGTCFVAMWFDPSVQRAYDEGFAPGIRAAGYKPFRVDEANTNQGISDRILAEIRTSEFVVADFTGQRQSVYYEAGFARGLGREVIWCCHEADVGNLHFDIKHLGHVIWKEPADLETRLADSIRANIVRRASR
jgi:hypothetical protein